MQAIEIDSGELSFKKRGFIGKEPQNVMDNEESLKAGTRSSLPMSAQESMRFLFREPRLSSRDICLLNLHLPNVIFPVGNPIFPASLRFSCLGPPSYGWVGRGGGITVPLSRGLIIVSRQTSQKVSVCSCQGFCPHCCFAFSVPSADHLKHSLSL